MSANAYGSSNRPSGGVELFTWLFMRLSGVALLFLALGHLFIMHVFNSVHTIDYDFVVHRYQFLRWRLYDMALLWLTMLHGFNGIRILIDDYLKPDARKLALGILYTLGAVLLAIGTWVIVCFNPGGAV